MLGIRPHTRQELIKQDLITLSAVPQRIFIYTVPRGSNIFLRTVSCANTGHATGYYLLQVYFPSLYYSIEGADFTVISKFYPIHPNIYIPETYNVYLYFVGMTVGDIIESTFIADIVRMGEFL